MSPLSLLIVFTFLCFNVCREPSEEGVKGSYGILQHVCKYEGPHMLTLQSSRLTLLAIYIAHVIQVLSALLHVSLSSFFPYAMLLPAYMRKDTAVIE